MARDPNKYQLSSFYGPSDGFRLAVSADFDKLTKTVTFTGEGYEPGSEGDLKTTVTLHKLTVKQCAALEYGLKVLEFLRTGELPHRDFGVPVQEPNVIDNKRVAT